MKAHFFILLFLVTLFPLKARVAKGQTAQKNKVTDIVVVFKMHVDVGYTNWAEGVLQKYCNEMLEETLRSIDETADLPESEQFVWTLPAWPLKYMLEHSAGSNKTRLEKAVRDGRIVPHALPVTFETEAGDLENLARGFHYGLEINRSFGFPPPRGAKLTDVPSHSRIIPTVLKNAGVDFLHIGCNPGSASPDVPVLFWWQGPDGSRLLTFYWAKYYGSGILPPEGWPHKTWLAMIHTHENTGAPKPEDVAELLKTAREKLPGVRIKIGRLSDFYDLLMKENPDLPVITGDMPDTWIHGYMSKPRETKLSKHLQRETYNTEILNTQLGAWTGEGRPVDAYIAEAVENMILYDEHTFGIAMTHGDQQKWTYNDAFRINKSLGNYDFIEGSWVEKSGRIRKAEKIVVPLMKGRLKQLASSVAIDGKRVVVYNPLPWSRSGRVKMFEGVYKKDFKTYALKDAETGKVIPVYEDYNLLSFDAEDVPAMGYKTYIPVLEPVGTVTEVVLNEKDQLLENAFFRLKINPETGALVSVYDKKNGMELVDQNSDAGFGAYIYEMAGQEQIDAYNKNYVKPGAEGWANQEMIRLHVPNEKNRVYKGVAEKIVYKDMGNAVSASVFGKLNDPSGQHYLVTYSLYQDQPYVEIVWGVEGKNPVAQPEAGWLAFPFALQNPEYRLYRTGGIVDPQRELVDGSNHEYYFLNTSMTMFNHSGKGAAINCPDAPGISIDAPGLFKYSRTKELKTGKVFVNLYNNQWGTNFTEWIEGSFYSKFYIWSYRGYDPEKNFITPSEETRVSLRGVYFDGGKGDLPLSQQGIALSRRGILVTAFGKNPDGEGTLLRLWEQAGSAGKCTVVLPGGSPYTKALRCNLRGELLDDEAIDIGNNTFEIQVGANQPVSLILK